jgi:hypothetical protein
VTTIGFLVGPSLSQFLGVKLSGDKKCISGGKMKIKELLNDESCDRLDLWRGEASTGNKRGVSIEMGTGGWWTLIERKYTVEISKVTGQEVEESTIVNQVSGMGRRFSFAVDIALRRFAGERIDLFGEDV